MAQWARRDVNGLSVYQAEAFLTAPDVVQGFTTRHGGASAEPYASLNLGAHVGDAVTAVKSNRQRLWSALDFAPAQVALGEQVHGNQVVAVERGGEVAPGADALVTDCTDLLLMLFFADCVPIFIFDPVKRCIALIHSGWRGTVSGIVSQTVATLRKSFGTRPETCQAAVGPCIGGKSYEVGPEVAEQFRGLGNVVSEGALCRKEEAGGRFTLNLRRAIHSQLLQAGVRPDHIFVSEEDTYRDQEDFFSFRRDGKSSGRMAGFLALRNP